MPGAKDWILRSARAGPADKWMQTSPLGGVDLVECWFKTCIFCHIFNFYCPYRGKLYPIIIVLGVNLCYTISVSLCLKIGRAGFRACFPRVDTAVLADRERQHLPRSRRLLHAPPACPRILGRAAIPCRMQPEFCGTMRRSYFIIVGGGLCFVCKNWAAACGAAVHCLD